MSSTTYPTTWSKPKLIASPLKRYGLYAVIVAYLIVAGSAIEFDWSRLNVGLERGWAFLSGFFKPNITSRWDEIVLGMKESLAMTVTATVAAPVVRSSVRRLVHRRAVDPWVPDAAELDEP